MELRSTPLRWIMGQSLPGSHHGRVDVKNQGGGLAKDNLDSYRVSNV